MVFRRHHLVYPTVTRVNAASFSTGAYPEAQGLLGNAVYLPRVDASGFLDTADRHLLARIADIEDSLLTAFDRYAVDAFLKVGIPHVDPSVTVLWLGALDGTAHAHGSGRDPTLEVLRTVDAEIARVEDGLSELGLLDDYDGSTPCCCSAGVRSVESPGRASPFG